MAPRKANKIENVTPQRSSARLRLRKQQDASPFEKEVVKRPDQPLESEVPQSFTWRPRRTKQENLPLVTEEDSSSLETFIEVDSDDRLNALTSPRIEHPGLTGVEKEREVFDPAWLVSSKISFTLSI